MAETKKKTAKKASKKTATKAKPPETCGVCGRNLKNPERVAPKDGSTTCYPGCPHQLA